MCNLLFECPEVDAAHIETVVVVVEVVAVNMESGWDMGTTASETSITNVLVPIVLFSQPKPYSTLKFETTFEI